MRLIDTLSPEMRDAVSQVLRAAKDDRSYLNCLQLTRELDGLRLGSHIDRSLMVRVALLSSFTIENVVPHFYLACLEAGLHIETFVGAYNQVQTLIRNDASELYAFRPDLVFLVIEPDAIVPGLPAVPTPESMHQVAHSLGGLIEQFKARSSATLVLHNLALPTHFADSVDFPDDALPVLEFNLKLAKDYAQDPQVRVLDFSRFSAFYGEKQVRDPRLRSLADIEFSEAILPALARKYTSYTRAVKGMSRKCLVLDLDNTLWGGVLGEDGAAGLLLSSHGRGRAFHEFQRAILRLHQRGVLLAVNSKNDAAEALEVMANHPEMLLRPPCIASVRINWQDKVQNMREIAEELNLGLDSFVFLDDNPVERERVRQALPEVAVPDLPRDPDQYMETLESLGLFDRLYLTEEDRRRTESYSAKHERQALEQSSGSVEEFLRSLNTVLTVFRPVERDIARLAQLCQKTNQFNLTTRRYSETDLRLFLSDRTWRMYALRVRDRFDDSGLVGLAIVQTRKDMWRLDTFLMSCRVLGRSIESAFLREILKDACESHGMALAAEYIPTQKNGPAKNFLPAEGFVQDPSAASTVWSRQISPETIAPIPYFTIARASDGVSHG